MWVSGFACAGLLMLLLLLTTWSSSWRRMLDWEEDFWKRRRVGGWLLTRLRRMETNKFLVLSVVALLVVHFGLLAVSVGAQMYFGPRLKARAVHSTPAKSQPTVR